MSTNTTDKDNKSSPLVLCLSGGGFRATFFHLGVIRQLATSGWLEKVTHVFSVSGGSILAAHMALNWESYISSDDDDFQRVVGELIEFGQMDVRGSILRRWIPVLLGRTRLFEHYLNKLYESKKLGELPDTPKFHFLATSLTSGQLCSFAKDQWIAMDATDGGSSFAGVKSDYLDISRVVAASAAFPPLFPPVRIKATGLSLEQEHNFPTTHYLADGGIFDNLGIAEVLNVLDNLGEGAKPPDRPIRKGGTTRLPDAEPPPKPSRVIVSDASASFDHAKRERFGSIVSRTSRATEIMMARLAQRDIRRLSELCNPLEDPHGVWDSSIVHLRITFVPPSFESKSGFRYETLSASIQERVRFVRTDLDRFEHSARIFKRKFIIYRTS